MSLQPVDNSNLDRRMHILNHRRRSLRNRSLSLTQLQQRQFLIRRPIPQQLTDRRRPERMPMGNLPQQQRRTEHATASDRSLTYAAPAVSAPTAATEASAWRTAVDPNSKKVYYWNIHTRESRWKKPIELATPAEREEMERKEREQRNFFEEMERNILRRLQDGDRGIGGGICGVVADAAVPACVDAGKADHQECLTPIESDPSPLEIQESWVQSWIANSSSPMSLGSSSVSSGGSPLSSTGSFVSLECEDERDDKVAPLKKPTAVTTSKLERISKMAIDKPNLVRTISKMEYDLTLLLRGIEKGSNPSPNGVNDLLSPGETSSSDLLASLCITHEPEGVGCNILSLEHILQAPLSPATSVASSITDEQFSPSSTVVKPTLVKRNTCGTIYLGSTLSNPDKDALIKCVCGVFRAHLLQSDACNVAPQSSDRVFDDDYQPTSCHRTGSNNYLDRSCCDPIMPTLEDITSFYRDIFLRSQMEVDCIVISLIYIERLIKKTLGRLRPTPANWRSLLFSCMVLSSKVWDDLSMWNADFSKIGPSGVTFSLRRTNELEVALLTALEYKVKVNASEYAKYYFLLRSMLCRSGLANDNLITMNPLDLEGVKSLGERTGASYCDLSVVKPFVRARSKSLGDVDNKDDGSETGFNAAIGGSPKLLSKKVSLEHLVRM
ncbi:hypothetical protein HJC23_006217 [Cyclotella cryptica]|uniref:WW domain-containing protein n=1 Tax=Cyclotella cryptica TaxID=29204 RepID=A0ABD3PWB5_9STRA|eukprot:CCRYP_010840-RA/>CCRYP_010840-RA protein AED:0.43 eAED:0.30 QI:0/-1/0/1/-1/1/1/0/667